MVQTEELNAALEQVRKYVTATPIRKNYSLHLAMQTIDRFVRESEIRPQVVIVIEGGLVQDILADTPTRVAIVDYDTEESDKNMLWKMPQGDGRTEDCYGNIRQAEVLPARVAEMFAAFESPDPLYADWKYAVDNEDTTLGFDDWKRHKTEADGASPNPASTGAYATDYELGS